MHFGGDRIYIYPDNLNAKATLWLWQLRDLAVIGIGLLIAVLALTFVVSFYITEQQIFEWEDPT